MKKVLTIASLGLASVCFQSASAETVESLEPLLLSESAKAALIVAQANDSKSSADSSNEEDPDQRVDGFYFPLAIGGQQFSGFGLSNTINGEDYSGSLNSQFGFAGETGIGYKFGDFRTELLYGYSDMPGADAILGGDPRVQNIKSSNSNMQTLTFGLLYDINTNSRWTPYLGGTIGVGWLTLGGMSFDVGNVGYSTNQETQAAIVYGGKAGLSYRVSRAWDVYLEGAYTRTGDYNFDLEAKGRNRRTVEKDEVVEEDAKVETDSMIERDSIIEQDKVETSTKTETETITVEEKIPEEATIFDGNATARYRYGPEGERIKVTCAQEGESLDRLLYPWCFKDIKYDRIVDVPEQIKVTTTTRRLVREQVVVKKEIPVRKDSVVKKNTLVKKGSIVSSAPQFSGLDFAPGDGWSVKVGFRWFFNQPANDPVVAAETVEPAPEPAVQEQQAPVRGLW